MLKDGLEEELDEEQLKVQWRAMGLKLFKKKYYHSVIK